MITVGGVVISYMTDGKRLVEVLLVEENGDLLICDCVHDEAPGYIYAHELAMWRAVDRGDQLAAA